MSTRQRNRAGSPTHAAWIAVAGAIIASGALSLAGPAAADPAVPSPTPVAPTPGAAAPAPGQPVAVPSDGSVGPPPPPPVGAPPVPEIPDPTYGQGQTPGQLGYIRDIWHSFHSGNPLAAMTAPPDEATGPPPGAGPPPGRGASAAAAARVRVADGPAVLDPRLAKGARRDGSASAAWVLPAERAPAARVGAAPP